VSLEKDQAVCLARIEYSESSQILVFFTRDHGKQRLIAKGIRRSTKARFAAGIDLLEAGQVVFSRREDRPTRLGTLVEWHQTDAFLGLRSRLKNLYAAQYAAEVAAQLTEDGDPHPRLFEAILELLGDLSRAEQPLPALVRFQQRLLSEIGLAPELRRCLSCGRRLGPREPSYFSSTQGGTICRHCEAPFVEKRRIGAGVLAGLWGTEPLTAATAVGAFDLLNYHLAHLMGREPRLAGFLVPPQERRRLGPAPRKPPK